MRTKFYTKVIALGVIIASFIKSFSNWKISLWEFCADFYQYLKMIDDIPVAGSPSNLHLQSLSKADTLLHTHTNTL